MGNINGVSLYPKEYLDGIKTVFRERIDGNGGKKDGKVTVAEAYKDLDDTQLLAGLKKGSAEYNKLNRLMSKIPEALRKYAGSDGIFQAEEYAKFLNGKEWGAVIDQYHSSSNFSKIEMRWIDQSKGSNKDGECSKGEVKAGLLNSLQKNKLPLVFDKNRIGNTIKTLVDKYAGADGKFTVAEYTAMKNDPTYKQIIKDFNLVPFSIE